jgi:hypothetical protein
LQNQLGWTRNTNHQISSLQGAEERCSYNTYKYRVGNTYGYYSTIRLIYGIDDNINTRNYVPRNRKLDLLYGKVITPTLQLRPPDFFISIDSSQSIIYDHSCQYHAGPSSAYHTRLDCFGEVSRHQLHRILVTDPLPVQAECSGQSGSS